MKVEGWAGMMPEAPSADRFCLGSRPLGVTAISSAVARQRARALELLLSAASSDVLRRDLRSAAQEERIGSSPETCSRRGGPASKHVTWRHEDVDGEANNTHE